MQKFNFILLVDDDPIANFLSEKLLCKMNCAEKIEIALNGEQALQIIGNECTQGNPCPDLILLDINMPVMTGFDFLEKFKQGNYKGRDKSRIVILTTSSHKKDYNTVNSFGITEIIQKPLTESKLKQVFGETNLN